jgi:hypothetical protein
MMVDSHIAVYRNNVDLFFYIVGSADENELILANILNLFYDSISIILKYVNCLNLNKVSFIYRNQVEKRVLMDHLESILLALDETIDYG